MRPSEILADQRERVLVLALDNGASAVCVFGWVVKGLDQLGSDIDLLVDVPAGTLLLQIVSLQIALHDALGTKVDLCAEGELPLVMRSLVLAEVGKLL